MEYINYTLLDLQGKLILQGSYQTKEPLLKKDINLPYLNRGMYLLYLNDGSLSKTIKLIKE